ncbi:MAG: ATP-binding protein [Opitutales bacterium]
MNAPKSTPPTGSHWFISYRSGKTLSIAAGIAGIAILGIVSLLLAGGTAHFNPGILLICVVLAGFYFGPLVGIATALVIGLAIGPWMPSSPGIPQPISDWLPRILTYIVTGGLIGALSLREYNRSQKIIRGQQQLLQATPEIMDHERIKALRQMAQGVVHDMNNALSPVLGFSELLLCGKASRDPKKVKHYAEAINTSAANGVETIKRLKDFYQQDSLSAPDTPINVLQLVKQSLAMTEARWKSQPRAADAEIAIEIDCPMDLMIMGNDAELRGVLTNLIFNAVDAMPEGGKLTFKTEKNDKQIILRVTDTGVGMDPDTLHRCFEPYFTTKENGTGMGLPLGNTIMSYCGGEIEISSAPGEGACVSLLFPIPETAPMQCPVQNLPAMDPLRILIAEDEPLIRKMYEEILTAWGHRITSAADGQAALDIFRKDSGQFDLMISDSAMPRLSGGKLIQEIRQLRQDIPAILLTGFDTNANIPLTDGTARTVSLTKPVTHDELYHALWLSMSNGTNGATRPQVI